MINRCSNCNKKFGIFGSKYKLGIDRFCSKKCGENYQNKKHTKRNKKEFLEIKKELIEKINDSNQTKWVGIIILILFFWSGIGLIIGLILILSASERKREYNQDLVEVDYELSN